MWRGCSTRLGRAAHHWRQLEALSLTHHCVLGPEHGNLRAALADELIRVGASTGRPSDTVMGLLWRTVDLFLAGDRQAERAYAELLGHGPANQNAAASFATHAIRVMLTIRAGHMNEAETLAEECAPRWRGGRRRGVDILLRRTADDRPMVPGTGWRVGRHAGTDLGRE